MTMMFIFYVFYVTTIGETVTQYYEPHLKVGDIDIDLPKLPPKDPEIRDLYEDAEIFAHYYNKKLQNLKNPVKRSILDAKKFESDFKNDFRNLKAHLRHAGTSSSTPTVNDANLFQLVNEFVRKLALISVQTHCFIFGCDGTVIKPITPPKPLVDINTEPTEGSDEKNGNTDDDKYNDVEENKTESDDNIGDNRTNNGNVDDANDNPNEIDQNRSEIPESETEASDTDEADEGREESDLFT